MMTGIVNAVFSLIGIWMLLYRLAVRSRFRSVAEAITTAAGGASLALLAPLMPWPPPPFSVLTLAVCGALLSFCHSFFTALMLALTLGVGLGGLMWQLGACNLASVVEVPYLHGIFLTLTCFIFVAVFVYTPGIAGPGSLNLFLAPCLGALLLTTGIAGLASGFANFGLAPEQILAEGPCVQGKGQGQQERHEALAAWLLVAACGIALQLLISRQKSDDSESNESRGDLVAALLPSAGAQEGGGANIPRPGETSNGRFGILTKAIFADEGADQSHLTETEIKIVEICKKDEFERDRILWGGGLI
mmetsp:Transcript_64925/g.104900  ORF Transcript_64925/g.104900 Transcript_64925/m.104900 type:complete len:304 (+) Transcript_64925:96-1007(+)